MALQVWLPLINDFHNQGLASEVQFTQYGTITKQENKGKIGSCYSVIRSADGQTGSLAYHGFSLPSTGWSMCLWAKFTAFPANSVNSYLICLNTSSASNCQAVLGLYRKSATTAYFCFNLYASGRIYSQLELNKWYHLCITYDGTKGYMYVNGELKVTVNSPNIGSTSATNLVINGRSDNSAGTTFTGTNTSFYMNDVRVYDNCLSAKEIKEISKALTIHFKLDQLSCNGKFGNMVADSSGFSNNGYADYSRQTFSVNSPRNSTADLRDSAINYLHVRIDGSAETRTGIYFNGNCWMCQGADALTVSEWAYATNWADQTTAHLWSCTESGGFNTEKGNTGYLRIPLNVYTNSDMTSYSYKYTSNEININNLSPGWHMFTFTYEQTYGTKVYIDGELHSQNAYTSYGLHFNTTKSCLVLGAESSGLNSSTSPYFTGGLSDFRLYYTAISATDIKELHEITQSIDDKGNLYAYEFIEDVGSSLTETGVMKTFNVDDAMVWLPLDSDVNNVGTMNANMVVNGATLSPNGRHGGCYVFDGTNDSIVGTPAPLNNNSNEWSYVCWFKPTNSHQGCLYCNRTAVTDTGITIFYYQTKMYIDDGGRWQPSSKDITVGAWNHIAITRKKGVGVNLYVNGVLSESTTVTHTPSKANATGFSIGMSGTNVSTTGNPLNGSLEDVRVYNRCLTEDEVNFIYTNSNSGFIERGSSGIASVGCGYVICNELIEI